MKKNLLCLLSFLFISAFHSLFAGNDPSLMGARGISLGKAYTAVRGDLWGLSFNPAGISGLSEMQTGFFAERRFSTKELLFGGIAFAAPIRQNHFIGVECSSFGFSNYRETKISATYATDLLKVIHIGTKVNYANLAIQDIGSTSAFWLDLGMNVKVTKTLMLGASAYNVNQAKVKTYNGKQNIPTALTAGLSYTPSDKVMLNVDVQKQMTRPVSFRGGVEYNFYKGFYARVGAATQPTLLTFGTGWKFKNKLSLDFAGSLHSQLGFTPYFSMTYHFGKKQVDVLDEE
jgi:hypothetical protein